MNTAKDLLCLLDGTGQLKVDLRETHELCISDVFIYSQGEISPINIDCPSI